MDVSYGIMGVLLKQTAPSTNADTLAFTALIQAEIVRIVVANTTGMPCSFRIFHNDTGSTYSRANALYYDVPIAANTTYTIEASAQGTGIFVSTNGTIGVQCATAGGCTFSFYGRIREGR